MAIGKRGPMFVLNFTCMFIHHANQSALQAYDKGSKPRATCKPYEPRASPKQSLSIAPSCTYKVWRSPPSTGRLHILQNPVISAAPACSHLTTDNSSLQHASSATSSSFDSDKATHIAQRFMAICQVLYPADHASYLQLLLHVQIALTAKYVFCQFTNAFPIQLLSLPVCMHQRPYHLHIQGLPMATAAALMQPRDALFLGYKKAKLEHVKGWLQPWGKGRESKKLKGKKG